MGGGGVTAILPMRDDWMSGVKNGMSMVTHLTASRERIPECCQKIIEPGSACSRNEYRVRIFILLKSTGSFHRPK